MEKVLMIIVSAAAVGMIVLRGMEIAQSEDGLWPSRASIGSDPSSPLQGYAEAGE